MINIYHVSIEAMTMSVISANYNSKLNVKIGAAAPCFICFNSLSTACYHFIIASQARRLQQQVHLQLMILFLRLTRQVHVLISKIYHFLFQ